MKKIPVFLVLSLVLLALGASAASARPGALEHSFGNDGRVVINVPAETVETGYAQKPRAAQMVMAVTPRGGSVVARGPLVFMRRPDGRPAVGFGGDGRIAVEPPIGWSFELADLAVDTQGRVLVAGTLASTTVGLTPDPPEYNEGKESHGPQPRTAVVFRYLPDGELDPSFDGDGMLVGSFDQKPPTGPGPYQYEYSSSTVGLTSLAIAPDGDLVLGGYSAAHVTGGCAPPISGATGRSFLARLNPDGTMDQAFGANGVVTDDQFERLGPTVLDANGRIASQGIAGGYCGVRGPAAARKIVSRLPDGQFDPSFGEGGGRPEPGVSATDLAFDSHGRLLVLGYLESSATFESVLATPGWRVKRLLPSGKPDPAFGRNGTASPKLPQRTILEGIALDGRGRIALAGYDSRENGTPKRFLLTRLSGAGKREPGFGERGWTATAFGDLPPSALEVAVARGRIFVGGVLARSDGEEGIVKLAISRYLSN
jgi:uncharacterized delta-60 repeat protein